VGPTAKEWSALQFERLAGRAQSIKGAAVDRASSAVVAGGVLGADVDEDLAIAGVIGHDRRCLLLLLQARAIVLEVGVTEYTR